MVGRPVVVFVPGIMASRLATPEGQEVWPSSIAELLLPYRHMPDLMREDLVVTDVIRRVSISSQYEGLLNYLERCDFHEKDSPPTLYVQPYDWRKDNALAARGVFDTLRKALADHSPTPPRVTLIGHSMGGLICRYLLESGKFHDTKEWQVVERFIALGTPHRGAPLGEPFLWDEGNGLRPLDPYQPAVAAALNLVSAQLQAARDFHTGLDVARKPSHTRYFFFVGTRQRTITAVGVRSDPANPGAYLGHSAQRVEADQSGDGTVPAWSGSLTAIQNQCVGGEHAVIFRGHELRLTLSSLLEKPGILGDEGRNDVEVAVRDRVLAPAAPLHVALSFTRPRESIEGELRLFPADDARRAVALPVSYRGLAAETLSLAFDAPGAPGAYHVQFHDGNRVLGADELFVQAEA